MLSSGYPAAPLGLYEIARERPRDFPSRIPDPQSAHLSEFVLSRGALSPVRNLPLGVHRALARHGRIGVVSALAGSDRRPLRPCGKLPRHDASRDGASSIHIGGLGCRHRVDTHRGLETCPALEPGRVFTSKDRTRTQGLRKFTRRRGQRRRGAKREARSSSLLRAMHQSRSRTSDLLTGFGAGPDYSVVTVPFLLEAPPSPTVFSAPPPKALAPSHRCVPPCKAMPLSPGPSRRSCWRSSSWSAYPGRPPHRTTTTDWRTMWSSSP